MRHAWLVLILLACNGGPAGEGPTETWAFAVAQPDCAPWDGAATAVILTNAPTDSVTPFPLLNLAVYRGPGAVGGKRFELGGEGTEGASATFCAALGECLAATKGWIAFEPRGAGAGLAGSYDLTFPDGLRRSGRFSAPLRERQALCG